MPPPQWTQARRDRARADMRARWAAARAAGVTGRGSFGAEKLAYLQEQLAKPSDHQPSDGVGGGARQAALPRTRLPAAGQGRPNRYLRGPKRDLTAEALREWCQRLHLSVPTLAFLLGRSDAAVYGWMSGEQQVPGYVVAWLELLGAFDKTVREHVPREELLRTVYGFVSEQPDVDSGAVEDKAARISQRLALPVGVVLECLQQLVEEGVLK